MITNTKFYQENKKELVLGLVWGLIVGLVLGLVLGLVWGLVLGLVWGLIVGLVLGLVVILVNFPEAFPFLTQFKTIVYLIFGIIVLIEIWFWLDNSKKPKSESLTKFTLKRKFEAFVEVMLGLSGIAQIYILIREGSKYLTQEVMNEILKWVGYIEAGIVGLVVIVFVIYLWIKLNELKYKTRTGGKRLK